MKLLSRFFLYTIFLTMASFNAFADEIGVNLNSDLDGKLIAYEYKGGRNYEIKFDSGRMTYHRTNGDGDLSWRSTVPYMTRKIAKGEYFIGWHETDISNYVTLLIHTEDKKLFSSAILGDYDLIHFQEAKIVSITEIN